MIDDEIKPIALDNDINSQTSNQSINLYKNSLKDILVGQCYLKQQQYSNAFQRFETAIDQYLSYCTSKEICQQHFNQHKAQANLLKHLNTFCTTSQDTIHQNQHDIDQKQKLCNKLQKLNDYAQQ